ncbi:MAG: RHS repeat-associated core domain-containing protein, partial [Lentisphaerae bacterium]|nr:RHS repeat-associated core domain-containing protein [Lentisphaerota bacterium]
ADRLVSATVAVGTNTFSETYLYDGNGALTNKQSAIGNGQYEYDCAGRMTFASAGNATLSVTYDALGNRLTTYAANATRIWITDHADPRKRPLMEADAYGVPIRYFIWGGGLLLAVVEADGTIRYAHSDEQGSVVALTDDSGAVTDQYCYGPFGTDWGHSGTNSIPFRWLGSHGVFNVDGSALHLTRYRAYDASLCRFLSQDPLGLGGGPNLYAYCMGNPLAYIDPLGLCGESVIASVGDFLADMFLNKGDIVNAWELVSGADYHKSRGWLEGAFGTVGLLALTADAAFNVVPGKAAVEAGIKTGIKEVAEAGAKAFAKDVAGEIAEKAAKSADKFSRTPKSLMDEMVLDAAKKGKGNLIIENLNDPKFKGMDKWRYGEKSTQGLNSEVHYVGDPKTGELMDFKFKHHAEIFR